MKHRILYAEDEPVLGQLVKEALQHHGLELIHVSNGTDAIPAFKKHNPHLCLLDIMMPGTDGYEVATMIRKQDRKIPLLFLTARVQAADLLKGFAAGCNDYVRKPFHMEELIVRIDNWLHVVYGETDTTAPGNYAIGSVLFDTTRQFLTIKEETIKLSHKEAELLIILCEHKNTIVSRDYILQKVWGSQTIYTSRILDVYLSRLRKYLEPERYAEIITLRGIGFKFIFP